MRYTQQVTVAASGNTVYSVPIILSPRYSSFEAVVQRMTGTGTGQMTLEATIESIPEPEDWFALETGVAVASTVPVTLGYYPVTYQSVRLKAVGTGTATFGLVVTETTDAVSSGDSSSDSGTGGAQSLKVMIDDTGTGTTYIGEALPGTLGSAASWRIKRIIETGPDMVMEWADANSLFDNVWNNRLSLTYG